MAAVDEGIMWPTTWRARVCLEVTLEPQGPGRRGTVTSVQTPCSVGSLPTEPLGLPEHDRSATVTLGLHRTTVPAPTTPPPDRVVCYSGPYCEDDANPPRGDQE